MPAETDVVIIGGGVVGVTAALLLAEWGVPCVLCEKGRIAGEQSSRNWGWIRKQSRDARLRTRTCQPADLIWPARIAALRADQA